MISEESANPDPVELVRRPVEAGNHRDWDAVLAFWGPDPVWDMSPMGMSVHEGAAAIRGFFEDWVAAYEEFEMQAEEVLDLSNGVTFGVFVQRGRPIGSSGEVTVRYGAVGVWDGAFQSRATNYADVDEARAAAERLAQERG